MAYPLRAATTQVRRVRQDVIYFRYLVRQLAAFFECEPTIEAVVEARNQAAQDFRGYVKRLYDACGLITMIADFGYPKPPLNVAQFKADSPIEVIPIYRIETFIDSWLDKDISWG